MKQLLKKAVETPLGYPPLHQAVFPGDRVALVPDAFVMRNEEVLAVLIAHLVKNGVTPSDITVMMTGPEWEREEKTPTLRPLFPKKWQDEIVFCGFFPYKGESCSLLCNRSDGEPIALARPIVDADVVIPIERHYPVPPLGHFGILSSLAPRFCDLKTQIRFLAGDRPVEREKVVEEFAGEIREMADRLGVAMTIEVLAPDGDKIDGFLYGDPIAVDRHLKAESESMQSGTDGDGGKNHDK